MADENEVINDNFTEGQDPLNDNTSETESVSGQAGEGTPETGDQAQVLPAGIEGTPFKDQAALIDGYKNIQRLTSTKDKQIDLQARRIADMQRQLDAAAQAIQEHFGKPTLPQGDEFWKLMAQDPIGLITKVATQAFEKAFAEKYGTRLDKSEQSLTQIQRQSLVDRFIGNHPDFTAEEEDAVVDILNSKPYLKDLPNGDGIEIAYSMVQNAKYQETAKTKNVEDAVAGAKGVASLGGKKSAAPAQAKQGDEFDEVLALDKVDRDLYNLGRKA